MDISKAQVETILKTLPIGYYIGRNIKVSLSETEECSFYDQINDEILISYQQLLKPFQAVEKVEDVEVVIDYELDYDSSRVDIIDGGNASTKFINTKDYDCGKS